MRELKDSFRTKILRSYSTEEGASTRYEYGNTNRKSFNKDLQEVMNQVWLCTSIISALGSLKQED
jgi:hypothetical protein